MTPDLRTPAPPQSGFDDNVYQRLLRERIIVLGSEVRDENANAICAQRLLLAAEDPDKDIYLYINSPGGSITSLFAIYDTMQYIGPDVSTVCMGMAASAAAVILAGGAKGKRFALPHARVMMHQPHGGAQGQATDIEIQAKLIIQMREQLNQILADHTGKDYEKVATDTERDYWMLAEEALEYGVIDSVITRRELTAVQSA